MPPKPRATAADSGPIITVPLSTTFCADDADVTIRADSEGTADFHVHKSILSLVSPTFKNLFTTPLPPADTPGTLPRVDVEGPPRAWENILRTIYPMPGPTIDDLDNLQSLLFTAKNYEMEFVINSHKRCFENQAFIQQDPLRLYAIACALGLEVQAKYVTRNAELLTVTRRSDAVGLKGLTVGSYHWLISFLVGRDNQWYKTLSEARISLNYNCGCNVRLKEELYDQIKENLKKPYLHVEDIYLKALEGRSRYSQPACASATKCLCINSEIRTFIERMIKERERVCDKLMREKPFVSTPLEEERCIIC